MVIPPVPTPAPRDDIIRVLVDMTLTDELRQELQRVKNELRVRLGPGASHVDVKAALTELVEAELSARGFVGVTCAEMQEIASDYCDRVAAGIDSWDQESQEQWKRICDEVMDVSSSDFP